MFRRLDFSQPSGQMVSKVFSGVLSTARSIDMLKIPRTLSAIAGDAVLRCGVGEERRLARTRSASAQERYPAPVSGWSLCNLPATARTFRGEACQIESADNALTAIAIAKATV